MNIFQYVIKDKDEGAIWSEGHTKEAAFKAFQTVAKNSGWVALLESDLEADNDLKDLAVVTEEEFIANNGPHNFYFHQLAKRDECEACGGLGETIGFLGNQKCIYACHECYVPEMNH
tara:strand:+ start:255 stop:605 length:351 start_codon:yes stop_codon:yes gene_type:complete